MRVTATEEKGKETVASVTEVEDGDAWVLMEALRSYCLEGKLDALVAALAFNL